MVYENEDAYTNYFNTKRKRSGHLFQVRDKAILVEADEYAVELSRYIHLNPVGISAVAKVQRRGKMTKVGPRIGD